MIGGRPLPTVEVCPQASFEERQDPALGKHRAVDEGDSSRWEKRTEFALMII